MITEIPKVESEEMREVIKCLEEALPNKKLYATEAHWIYIVAKEITKRILR